MDSFSLPAPLQALLAPYPPFALPESLPQSLPPARFTLGQQVVWAVVPKPDFGRVVGVIFSHEGTCQVTGPHYIVLLDDQSPSRPICTYDIAFEEDLKAWEEEP